MRDQYVRLVSTPAYVKRVRRSLKFSCGRGGLRAGISRIARSYGLVDERGSPHDAEVVRLLLVTALTQGQPNRVAVAVEYAVSVQRPMLAAALGHRITRRYATGAGAATQWTRGGARSQERRNQARVTLDDFLADALGSLALGWQDQLGVVHDGKMIADICDAGLRDPELPAILHWYVQRTARLRERLAQAEQWIAQVVDEAMSEGRDERTGT